MHDSVTSLSIMSESIRSRGRVLVVDDEKPNVTLLTRLLQSEGYEVCTAGDGESALEAVARERPDVILLDVLMPRLSGFDVCRRLKDMPGTRLTPVVLVTGLNAPEDKIEGINAGADDFLTKPLNPHELKARVRSLVRLKRYTDDLDSAESVILSLALTIEARDPSTQGHCQRLATYATVLGERLGLDEDDRRALHRGGYLHDVGKVGMPDALLLKPDRLTPQEFDEIKQHTVIGERLCGTLRSLHAVRPIIRHHHERRDGSGYPDGLKADAIPLLAQIIGIVDVYDALTTARPYKPAHPPTRAYEELAEEVRKGWRREDLVGEFIALARERQFLGDSGGPAEAGPH